MGEGGLAPRPATGKSVHGCQEHTKTGVFMRDCFGVTPTQDFTRTLSARLAARHLRLSRGTRLTLHSTPSSGFESERGVGSCPHMRLGGLLG